MDQRKTPTDHSVEELLGSLDSKETSEEYIPNTVLNFISAYKITPGKDAVSHRVLYQLYRLWCKDAVSKEIFELEMAKYFIIHQKGPRFYYLINQKALDLSKKAFKLILDSTTDRTKSPPWKKHFESFLSKYDLKPGDYYLESFVLYDLYDQYVYETKKKQPLGEDQFYNFCKLYFTDKRLTSNRVSWFGVDKSIKKYVTDDKLKTLRESRTKNAKKEVKKR